jgi:hypothetical protein
MLLLGAYLVGSVAPAHAGQTAPAVTPGLRSMDALAAPEGQVDSGVGVYPALAPPARLAFPDESAVAAASAYAARRGGRVAFAVTDGRGVAGRAVDAVFRSASLTKAMILVAFLRRAAAEGITPSYADRQRLGYMIRISDNGSADSIYAKVGDAALRDLARRAGMKRFSIAGDWGNATLTAADQARFFLALDGLLAPPERSLARQLLEGVAPPHSWGIPRISRPRWRTFFKGGWRPGGKGELVHQAALLERGARRLAVAVMTDGNPLQRYGEVSIEGVARLLLRGGGRRKPDLVPGPAPPLRAIAGLADS